jgi:hypothetical protein
MISKFGFECNLHRYVTFKTDTINFVPPYMAFCTRFDLVPKKPVKVGLSVQVESSCDP